MTLFSVETNTGAYLAASIIGTAFVVIGISRSLRAVADRMAKDPEQVKAAGQVTAIADAFRHAGWWSIAAGFLMRILSAFWW